MFNTNESRYPIEKIATAFHKMRKIKVILYCKKCGCIINTFWDGNTLDGRFTCDTAEWSEIFEENVTPFNEVVCNSCRANVTKFYR